MDENPRVAVADAAIDAVLDSELAKVKPSQTSVDLPESGESLDADAISQTLSDTTATDVRLNFDDDDYLRMMEAELSRLDSHDLLDGLAVITDDPGRFETDLKDRASGLYHTGTAELYVAPEEVIGEEPREREARPGYYSTDKNFGSIWHELGHHRIREENPGMDFQAMEGADYWGQSEIEMWGAELKGWDDWFDPESADPGSKKKARKAARSEIESEVSEYAGFGGMEFIAETFAGLMAGNEYSDDIMALHERLGGPVPPEGARDPSTAYEPMVAPGAIEAAVTGAVEGQIAVDQHLRRLERIVGDVDTTEIGDQVSATFTVPGADPNEISSGIQFVRSGKVADATIRLPSLQEASQATRGIINRFPDVVKTAGKPQHDTLVNLGFDSPADAPEIRRDERVIRLRLNDLRGSNRIRPHVILKTGPLAPKFEAEEVLAFLRNLIDAYEEEFKPYAPRDDIEFQAPDDDRDIPAIIEDAAAFEDESVEDVLDEYGAMHVTERDGKDYYAIHEDKVWVVIVGDDYAHAEPFNEWIYDSWTWGTGLGDWLDNAVADDFERDFYRSSAAYHVTEPDNAARIIVSGGLKRRNETRGTGNRGVGGAVFLSRDSPIGVYGDVTFVADVDKMQDDGFTPNVEMEPEVLEAKQRGAIASSFMVHDFRPDIPHDVSQDTAIIYEDIPLKYLSMRADDATVEAVKGYIEDHAEGEERDEAMAWIAENTVEAAAVEAQAPVDRIASTLQQVDAYQVRKTESGDSAVIDFKWTAGSGGDNEKLFASNIVVKDGEMHDAFFRQPPVPVDGYSATSSVGPEFKDEREEIRSRVDSVLERSDPPVRWTVAARVGHSETGPTPHINFHFRDPEGSTDIGEFTAFIKRFRDEYADEFPRADFGRDFIVPQGDFGEWPWDRSKAGLKQCEAEMEGEVDNQYAFCRAWANEAGFEYATTEAQASENPPKLVNALDRFDPDALEITGTGGRGGWETQFEEWYDAKDGVSGLYFPDHDTVVMDNRSQAHHNTQWHAVVDREMLGEESPSPVMPFTIDMVGDRWVVETARSHGGLTQALMKRGQDGDVKTLTYGAVVEPEHIWAVVYAARLADVPEGGEISYSFKDPGASVDPGYAPTYESEIGDLYRELSFEDKLPDPAIDREALAEGGPEAATVFPDEIAGAINFTADDIETEIKQLDSFDGGFKRTGFESEGTVAFEFKIESAERPTSLIYDMIRGRPESIIIRLPPLAPDAVNNGNAGRRFFDVFRRADRKHHAIPQDKADVLIAGPNGLTPHVEGMDPAADDRLFEFIDTLAWEFMDEFADEIDRDADTFPQLPPGWAKRIADIVVEHAREWAYDIDTEHLVGDDGALIEFYPSGFPRPDKTWVDNPTSIVIDGDGNLADAMFRYGHLPDTEWKPKDENPAGAEILADMAPDIEGAEIEYDLGDFDGYARPHLHIAGHRWADASGDVDWETVMDVAQEFGERLRDEYLGDGTQQAVLSQSRGLESEISDLRREAATSPSPAHSYRAWNPRNIRTILDKIDGLDDQEAQVERLRDVRGQLNFIEGGRFDPMLEALSDFLFKLDADEQELFGRRNPDMAEWTSVWQRANGFGGYPELVEIAEDALTGTMDVNRVGVPDREYGRIPSPDYQPPAFEPGGSEPTIEDMISRRRSYRNWSPFEFAKAVGVDELTFDNRDENIALTRGTLSELGFFTEVYPDLEYDDFEPDEEIDVRRGTAVAQLLRRVEGGRLADAIDEAINVLARMDPDEQRAFVLRNPGLSTWMGVYGKAKGLTGPHENDLSGAPWPPMGGGGSERAKVYEQGQRRSERFAEALTGVAEEWVDQPWMIDWWTDELSGGLDKNRVTLGIRLFPDEADINPSDIHFGATTGRIIDALLRFPDLPVEGTALESDEWDERRDRLREAFATVDTPDEIAVEKVMPAGHVGKTPHVEFEEEAGAGFVEPQRFAEWVADIKEAFAEEFADEAGEFDRPGTAHLDWSDPGDRREALHKVWDNYAPNAFQSAARTVIAEVAEEYFDMTPDQAWTAATDGEFSLGPDKLADFLEGYDPAIGEQVALLVREVLQEKYPDA